MGDSPRLKPAEQGWAAWLALNPSTLALLGAILLVTASTELWSPLVPEYVKTLREEAGVRNTGWKPVPQGIDGEFAGWKPAPRIAAGTILLIALYGFIKDALEAANYYAGGAIGGRLNTRRSLLLFNLTPLLGLAVVLAWRSPAAIFVALPLIMMWDSIAGPSIITVVGESVPAARRTMAFSMQAIFRRVARVFAYLIAGGAVAWFGRESGFRAAVGLGVVMLLAAVVLQYRLMRTATRDAHAVLHSPRQALAALRGFDPQLKRLLASDILARWAEGIPRELVILYCIPLLAASRDRATWLYTSVLLIVQAVTNVVMYVLIGPLASKAGAAKKPYIGLTFVFFAAFPLALALLGPTWRLAGLVVAFVVGGLREIGEPARKAMISELVDPTIRTQAIGLYWAARGAAVMPAGLIGGLVWIGVERVWPGWGARAMLMLAGMAGVAGAAYFAARFERGGASNLSG